MIHCSASACPVPAYIDDRFSELVGVPGAFGVASHTGFLSGRLTSSNEGTWVLFHHDSSAAPQTMQTASPVCGTKNFVSVRLYSAPQLHRTIVAILEICARNRPFSSVELCHNQTDTTRKNRAQNAVLRLPVRRHGRLFCGQHLRELVRGIAEQGSDHHRDNKQDQRIGERGRDQVLQWVAGAADGWCREYATSAA